jgi:hypothetical protein
VPEFLLQILEGDVRVLERVVQQTSRQRGNVETQSGEIVRSGDEMHNVRLAGFAHLAAVCLLRKLIGPCHGVERSGRQVLLALLL